MRDARPHTKRAPGRRHRARRHRARDHFADRRPPDRRVREADETIVRAAHGGGGSRRSPRGRRRRRYSARTALERAAELLEPIAANSWRCCNVRAARRLTMRSPKCARPPIYCRYYAAQARGVLAPRALPGPTGESNALRYRGRGVFVCISPWNFPLAIFLGQVGGGARRRQYRGGKARRADAAHRRSGGAAAARSRRADERASSPAGRRQGRRGAGRRSRALPGSAFTGSTEVGRASTARSPPRTDRSCR